jgi:hypothetical protein
MLRFYLKEKKASNQKRSDASKQNEKPTLNKSLYINQNRNEVVLVHLSIKNDCQNFVNLTFQGNCKLFCFTISKNKDF